MAVKPRGMKLFGQGKKTPPGRTSGLAEPSEVRFRAWLQTLALALGPALLLFLYDKTMFPGLTNPDALDFAQLGRNLGAGRGFVTDILRPLALTHGADPLQQPDVTHGPLLPFLLGTAFNSFGAKDTVAAALSGVFYLLTVPVLYLLGTRVFNKTVGLVTAAIFVFNALLLEYAASGTQITLYIFLMTCLLLILHELSAATPEPGKAGRLPRVMLLMAGALTGLLYLTDPIFCWVIPVVIGAVIVLYRPVWPQALALCLLPVLLLVGPWMYRNAALTGNPVFGLRGLELWMNTKGYYPGLIGYRMDTSDFVPGEGLFKAVVQKVLLGTGQVIQAFPQVTASWVLAFLLPSLLFRFADPAANSLRRIMMWCFLALFVGTLLFSIQMPLFVALIPTMLVFSVAYLLHLIEQANLGRGSALGVAALLAVAVVFPLVSDVALADRPQTLKEAATARALGRMTQKGEVSFSDQPWIVAWYADRPSLWIPTEDTQVAKARQRFPSARWLFLTDQAANFSPEWQYVYSSFQQWGATYLQAKENGKPPPSRLVISGKGPTLFEALDGFMSVDPVKDGAPSAVIAAVPLKDGAAKK